MPLGQYANFDACVAANQDKGDPGAYCGAIKRDTEDKADKMLGLQQIVLADAAVSVATARLVLSKHRDSRGSTEHHHQGTEAGGPGNLPEEEHPADRQHAEEARRQEDFTPANAGKPETTDQMLDDLSGETDFSALETGDIAAETGFPEEAVAEWQRTRGVGIYNENSAEEARQRFPGMSEEAKQVSRRLDRAVTRGTVAMMDATLAVLSLHDTPNSKHADHDPRVGTGDEPEDAFAMFEDMNQQTLERLTPHLQGPAQEAAQRLLDEKTKQKHAREQQALPRHERETFDPDTFAGADPNRHAEALANEGDNIEAELADIKAQLPQLRERGREYSHDPQSGRSRVRWPDARRQEGSLSERQFLLEQRLEGIQAANGIDRKLLNRDANKLGFKQARSHGRMGMNSTSGIEIQPASEGPRTDNSEAPGGRDAQGYHITWSGAGFRSSYGSNDLKRLGAGLKKVGYDVEMVSHTQRSKHGQDLAQPLEVVTGVHVKGILGRNNEPDRTRDEVSLGPFIEQTHANTMHGMRTSG